MAALQVKQICMYLELIDLPKMINTKLDQGEDRVTQTLVFPKFSYIYRNTWFLNLLRNIMMKIAVTAHSLCQRQCLLLKLDQMTKTKARERLKAKDSNFGSYTYK